MQPHPITPDWGEPRNFQWMHLTKKYWCKLCGKYADYGHINSKTHTHRQQYPDTYLWYLNENNKLSQEKKSAAPPPPPGPPPDYRHENNLLRTQQPPRGYRVTAPAPLRDLPAPLVGASEWSFEKQPTSRHCFDAGTCGSPYNELYHAIALRNSYARASAHRFELAEIPDPNQSFGAIPIEIVCGDAIQLPPVPVSRNGSDDPHSIVSNRWHRYAEDDTRAAYWWWNPVYHNICFREDAPGEWCKYLDPAIGKTYWYLSNEIWFWENTGNTMC